MRKFFAVFLSLMMTIPSVAQSEQPHEKSDHLHYRDIMYTTDGDLLVREVTDTNSNLFYFEECTLVPSEVPQREGHAVGACYELSPKFANTPAAHRSIGDHFADYLRHDLRDVKMVQMFSRWGLPIPVIWAARKSYLEWNRFYASAFSAAHFRAAIVAISLGILTTLLVTVVWDAWTSEIPSLETNLKMSDMRAEDYRRGSLSGFDIYLLFRAALRQATADPFALNIKKAPDLKNL